MAKGLNEKYRHTRGFDPAKLLTGVTQFIQSNSAGTANVSSTNAITLINKMALDNRLTDIRYMAYMLATVFIESRETQKFTITVPAKKAKPGAPPNQPTEKEVKLWVLFNPIDETGRGKGKAYYEPVKVERLQTGEAIITEKDGDQFKISADGKIMKEQGYAAINKRGSASEGPVSKKYTNANGDELQYFGRGLVQITWWNSYITAGIEFGYGLDLFFNPEKVKEFDVAYEILVAGMTTGKSYANGHKCSDYFTDSVTNYTGARAMVNGNNKAEEIAGIALKFENLLLAAKLP